MSRNIEDDKLLFKYDVPEPSVVIVKEEAEDIEMPKRIEEEPLQDFSLTNEESNNLSASLNNEQLQAYNSQAVMIARRYGGAAAKDFMRINDPANVEEQQSPKL